MPILGLCRFWQRSGLCEKLPEASPESANISQCLTEPVPAGAKMDPPLAKAEPVGDGHRASGITDLRRVLERGKLCERNCSWREE